jgi:hypothetical protein
VILQELANVPYSSDAGAVAGIAVPSRSFRSSSETPFALPSKPVRSLSADCG